VLGLGVAAEEQFGVLPVLVVAAFLGFKAGTFLAGLCPTLSYGCSSLVAWITSTTATATLFGGSTTRLATSRRHGFVQLRFYPKKFYP